jgi:hypothetical protein
MGVLSSMLLALLGCQREPTSAVRPMGQPKTATRPTILENPQPLQSPSIPAKPEVAPGEPGRSSTNRLRTDTWDFGVISPGTELRHRYTIRNDSPLTWTIKHVTPSCSCTLGEFTARAVKPGQATSLEVAYRAGKHDGAVYEGIMVEFAESAAPFFNLVLRGEIRGLLSPSPSRVDFGRVSAGARVSRAIRLRNYSDQDVTITRVQAPDWLRAELDPTQSSEESTRPRQLWKITVHADATKFRAGPEAAMLVVHTSAPKMDPVVIPVNLEIRAPLEVVPAGLDFRIVPAGTTRQQALMLDLSLYLGDVSEKDLLLTHPLGQELKIQVVKMAERNRFRLIGSFSPKPPSGARHGELEINVRGKTVPALRVAISAVVP